VAYMFGSTTIHGGHLAHVESSRRVMMHSFALLLPTLAALLDSVSAHGYVTGVRVNGVFFKGFAPDQGFNPVAVEPVPVGWAAKNNDLGFLTPDAFQTLDINCHKNATAAKAYAHANPGDTIEFVWNQWIESHKGPIINYIAPCNGELNCMLLGGVQITKQMTGDCAALRPSSLRWTKFSQDGLITPGYWITDSLMHNNYTATTTLPRNLRAGNYVVRHEIIALHGARQDNGAQSYPQCVNLKVGGSGVVAPAQGVEGTKLYSRTEKGMKYDIYDKNLTGYPIPGPLLWRGAD